MKPIQALFLVVSLTLTACGTASVARRDTAGGQIALSGGYMASRRSAQTLMAEECRGHFEVSDFQHGLSFRCQPQAEAAPKPPTMLSWVGR